MKEILFTGKIPITSSNEDIPWQMKCDITRTDDLVEIRLIDTRDIFTFFVCNLSQSDFYVLKQEQDLIVDYDSFIPILVKLFHGILTNRLFALFSKETTKFMFVEKSEFRNIVRLELKFLKPDENNFKRYLSDIIERMESDNIKLIKENGMLNSQCINGDKQMKDRINYLEKENKKQNLTISILTKDKDKLTNDNYNKGIEIKELKNKILTLEKDNSNLSYDLEKAKLEIVKYKNTLERNQEIEIELKDLKKEIETANEIIKEIREENKNLKIKNDKNEEGDKIMKNENKRLRNEGEDLKKRIKVLEEKSKKTKEDLKKKEEDLKTLEKENQNLIRKLENAQSVYNHFYNKNVERNSFSEESSGYSIHPESPP